MPLLIEITLITGSKFHADTDGVNADPAIQAFARKAKSGDWIETVEGAWGQPGPDRIGSHRRPAQHHGRARK